MNKIYIILLLSVSALAYTASAQTSSSSSTAVASDTVALKEYTGKYKFEGLPFDYMEFSLKEGMLNVVAGDRGGPLKPSKDVADRFEIVEADAKFTFIRDDQKKIVKVAVDYQGMAFEGKKD